MRHRWEAGLQARDPAMRYICVNAEEFYQSLRSKGLIEDTATRIAHRVWIDDLRDYLVEKLVDRPYTTEKR